MFLTNRFLIFGLLAILFHGPELPLQAATKPKAVATSKAGAKRPVARKPVTSRSRTAARPKVVYVPKVVIGKNGRRKTIYVPRQTGIASSPRPLVIAPARQYGPSPERYKEIQAALIARGYLPGEPTGEWNNDSSSALKKFQQDQSIEPDGRINSLSLIALGLGPKRENGQKNPE